MGFSRSAPQSDGRARHRARLIEEAEAQETARLLVDRRAEGEGADESDELRRPAPEEDARALAEEQEELRMPSLAETDE